MKYLLLVITVVTSVNIHAQDAVSNLLKQSGRKVLKIEDNPNLKRLSNKILKDSLNAKNYFKRAKAYYSLWEDGNKKDSLLYSKFKSDLLKSSRIDSLNNEIYLFIILKCELPDSSVLTFHNRMINYGKKVEENYYYRSLCLMRLGKFEDAINDLNIAIELAKKNHNLVLRKEMGDGYVRNRGVCYAKLKQFTLAEKDLQFTIKSNDKDYISYIYLGIIKSMEGQYQEALDVYNELLSKAPFVMGAYFFKGCIYKRLGNEDLANENWIRAFDAGVEVGDKLFTIETQLDYYIDSFKLGF